MANDPVINNIAGMAMQILHEAQGVRDISGAALGDYETISPETGASVQIVNAQSGVPFKKLVNILPRLAREGSGDPSLDNVRKYPMYEKAVLRNGTSAPIEVKLENFYSGEVDFIARQVTSTLVRARIPADVNWKLITGGEYNFFRVDDSGLSPWDISGDNKFYTGENCSVMLSYSSSGIPEGYFGLFRGATYPSRIYYRPQANQEFADVDAFKTWLTENEIYIYYRPATLEIEPIETTIPYVLMPEYTISADYGTLTVKYSGIATEGTIGGPGVGMASAPEQINRPKIPAIVDPETPAIVEPIAEEIKNQEDDEK